VWQRRWSLYWVVYCVGGGRQDKAESGSTAAMPYKKEGRWFFREGDVGGERACT